MNEREPVQAEERPPFLESEFMKKYAGYHKRRMLGAYFLHPDLDPQSIHPKDINTLIKGKTALEADDELLRKKRKATWTNWKEENNIASPATINKEIPSLTIENIVTYLHQFPEYVQWEKSTASFLEENNDIVEKLDLIFQSFGILKGQPIQPENLANLYYQYFWKSDDKQLTGISRLSNDFKFYCYKNNRFDPSKIEEFKDAFVKFSQIFGDSADEEKNHTLHEVAATIANYQIVEELLKPQSIYEILETELSQEEQALLQEYENAEILPKLVPFNKLSNRKELIRKQSKYDIIVIAGKPGSGKTTVVSRIYRSLLNPNRNRKRDHSLFELIEPTRITTTMVSKSIAELQHEPLGEKIGFIHGDDKLHRSKNKEIEEVVVMTNGIISPMIDDLFNDEKNGGGLTALNTMVGPDGVLTIMFDEVHKESPALVTNILKIQELQKMPQFQANGRSRIRIILATATGDIEKIKRKLGIPEDGYLEVGGDSYELPHRFGKAPSKKTIKNLIEERNTRLRNEILISDFMSYLEYLSTKDSVHNIMAFFPGKNNVKDAEKAVLKFQNESQNNQNSFFQSITKIVLITGDSTQEQRMQVSDIEVPEGERVLFICTNAAEAGITPKQVDSLYNTGIVNVAYYDWQTGATRMQWEAKNKGDHEQADGRAGRQLDSEADAPYHTKQSYNELNQFPEKAESERVLALNEILSLIKIGRWDLLTFADKEKSPTLTPFPRALILQTKYILGPSVLGAIDANDKITEVGEEILRLPIDPHLAKAVYEARNYLNESGINDNRLEEVASIAAILEAENRNQLFEDLDRTEYTDPYTNKKMYEHPEDVEKYIKRGRLRNAAQNELGVNDANVSAFMLRLYFWRVFESEVGSPLRDSASKEQKDQRKAKIQAFCNEYGVSVSAIELAEEIKGKIMGNSYYNQRPTDLKTTATMDRLRRREIEECMNRAYPDRLLRKIPNSINKYELVNNPISPDPELAEEYMKFEANRSKHAQVITINNGKDPFQTTVAGEENPEYHHDKKQPPRINFPEYIVCAKFIIGENSIKADQVQPVDPKRVQFSKP